MPTARSSEVDCDLWIVRLYDWLDGWIDVSSPVSRSEAERIWKEHTDDGRRHIKYEDGDYYAIYPANTRMLETPESRGR